MNHIWTICKREINAFFNSLTAYIILIVFLAVSGFFTWLGGSGDLFFVGQASLDTFFRIAFWTLFFFIPAITMRMIAEERRAGTLELLATKPVTDFQIVIGKWLASWLLVVISLLFTLPYYITVANLGNIDHGATFAGYFALILISGVYTSVGIFASSLTKNQIVALILSLFIGVFFHILFGISASVLPPMLFGAAEFLDLQYHYSTLTRGVITLESVTYMLSLIVIGFVLSTASLKRRMWT